MVEWIVVVSAALAFGPGCESGCPVLTGKDTPRGTHIAMPLDIAAVGFKRNDRAEVWAMHPVWSLDRKKMIDARLKTKVTAGCINMLPEDFAKLPKKRFKLTIRD